MRRQLPLDKGPLIAASLAVIFAVVFGLISLRLLFSFSMAGYDLTNMSQAMWNTAQDCHSSTLSILSAETTLS